MGGTKILAALVDSNGCITSRAKKKTRAELGPEAVLERIHQTARETLQGAGIETGQVGCLGIGAPGPLDPKAGVVLEAPNLKWRNVHLKAFLEEKLGIETYLSNDVNAGTWGEFKLGAGRGALSCVGVFIGTGIGGGLVLDGKLWEGASHVAGEIGHICVDPNGPVCGCGRCGCLEAFASRTAMTREVLRIAKKAKKTKSYTVDQGGQIRSKQYKQAFDSGDELFTHVIHNAAGHLGIGLGSVANLLNPECIILGGGLVEALGKPYVDLVEQSFNERTFASAASAVRIVEAALGDDAGIIGTALLARQAHAKAHAAVSSI